MGNEVGLLRSSWRSLFSGPETGKDLLIRETALFLIKRCED
jgi:hypothetical protein